MILTPLGALLKLFKSRIERDRLWMMNHYISGMSKYAWAIIVDYSVEDSCITDAIFHVMNGNPLVEYEIKGIMFQITQESGNILMISWNAGEHKTQPPQSQELWRVDGISVFTALLMLPKFTSTGREIAHEDDSPYLTLFRQYLYRDVNFSMNRRRYGET